MKLFNKTIDRQLFKQYPLGSDLSKQEVVAKIFNPYGQGTWFILNSDPEDPDYLWAIVDLGYGAEVGSVSRSDLETYRGRFGLGFERDLSFDPVNALELYNGLRQGKYYAKGGEIKNKYKSYADFVKQNIGKDKFVITVGSGGTSQPLEGATEESINKQFKSLVFHNFKDYEFSLNYMPENLSAEYNSFVTKYYNYLIENPNEFVKFWNEFIVESGNYDAIYEIKSPIYDEHGNYIESREWIDNKWVKNHIPHYPDLIFSKYKKEMSPQLIKEYKEYLQEYAGDEIGYNFANGGGVDDYSDLYGQEVMALKNAKTQAKKTKYDYVVYQNEEGEISFARKNDFDTFFDKDKLDILYSVNSDGLAKNITAKTNPNGNTFDNVFLNYGFTKKRGAYGIRPYENKKFGTYAQIDDKTRSIEIETPDDQYKGGYSVTGVIDFLKSKGFEENGFYADGGDIEVVYERRADFKKKPIKLLLLSRGKEQKGYTFSGKDQVAVLDNYNRNKQEDLEKLWNLKGYESKYADGGELVDYSDNQLMIMNQNVEVEHHHEELEDILEDKVPVPAWVVAKMETATQNLSDITHYLDGQKELMEDENEDENEEEDEEQDEIENKIVVEPIDVSAGTKTELTKKFTHDAMGNLKGFLKGMEGIDLRDDYTFDYKDEQYEVEPIINSDENGVSNAVFSIFDGDGEEVGDVAYSRDGGKQKFTANSEFFSWNNAKFEDGGYFDGAIPKASSYMSTYAKGGEVAKGEILGLKRNFMGTTDVEMKISGMRKPQSFIVYPISKDDSGDIITIQSETRIGKIDLSSGRGLMSQSHSNGAYFVHFQMDKLTPFTISESDLEDLKMQIFKTAGANVGTRGIVSDNSGASGVYADGGKTNKILYSLDQIEYDVEYRDKNGEKYSEIFNTKDEALKEIYRLEKLGFVVTSRKRSFKDDGTFNGFFADGGETEEGVDLFEDYENIPEDLQEILDNYQDAFEDGDYQGLEKALKEANAIGYTFEYYLDGQAYDLRKIGQKGKSEVQEYAKGGNIKKYILKADIKSVTVKRKGKEVTFKGADVLNGAHVLAKGGDITSKANYVGKNDVVEVELKDGSKVKPANGYWIKKGAEPVGAEPTPTASGKSETKFSETVTKKGIWGWDATTNVNDFNNYDWRITTFRGSSGKLISSAKGGKYEKGNGYTTFKYTMYDDPYHTLEVSQPSRLTEKVVTEQHEKALAKFKKFMETGTFGRGGKISKFDKLSDKVAKEYEGKPVKSQYQEEYGKYYSKEEAQEVGDKVAGKMKAMTADKKAFGGLFGGAKSLVSSNKYPDLDDKQVRLKSGQYVQVFDQSGKDLSVLEVGKIGTGERPFLIDISEVDMTSFKLGGETKKGRGGSEMLKQANVLAKKIRKDGESWNDAKKRAFAQLKK